MMKTKSLSKAKEETGLWRNSPCSQNYVLQNPSMDLSRKFHYGSIYFRDEVNKPKKVFTEFQRPDLLLDEFRRQIEQASHPKYNLSTKKLQEQRQKEKIKSKSLATTSYSKLYSVPQKIEYKYDKYGWRSNYTGEYNVKAIQSSVLTKRNSFSFGRRVDLSKPHNFYPGPGTYNPNNPHMKDFVDLNKTKAVTERMNKTDVNWRKKSTKV